MHKRTRLQDLTMEGGGHENCKVEFLYILKAAGTPMIKALPLAPSSLDRLTLFPGEFSTRTSRSGIRSPARTKAGVVVWKADTS